MSSLVAICPAALVDAANAWCAEMGFGSPSFTVPLSADGSEPATHYGLRADVSTNGQALIEANVPPELASVTRDYSETLWGLEHFEAVCGGLDLMRVEVGT